MRTYRRMVALEPRLPGIVRRIRVLERRLGMIDEGDD
jgi:hypothetical protein